MSTISKIHQEFSRILNNPRVLSNPEEFLGQNYRAVLNFWKILDELSKDQWKTIDGRHGILYFNQPSEYRKVVNEAFKASDETIGREFAFAAHAASDYGFSLATRELIGMHKILEQQKPLTFFEMFLEVL